mgnify:CR=1 FL=1
MQPGGCLADARSVKRKTRRAKKAFSEWSWTILIVWVVQVALLIYFLLTQTWSTYWFCRDLYKPGLALFSLIGRGFLPGECFNLLSRTGVLISFTAAALIYATVGVAGFHTARYFARK